MSESLGLLLVRAGLIDRTTLYEALELQRQTGRFLGSCLLAMEAVPPDDLKKTLSQQLGIPCVDGARVLAAPKNLASAISAELVARLRVVVFSGTDHVLQVALYSSEAVEALPELAFFAGKPVQAYLSDEAVVERCIASLYPELARPMARLPQRGRPGRVVTPPASPVVHPPSAESIVTATSKDLRRPEELLRSVEEISNRDFGRALGLEPLESVEQPIPLTSRVAASVPTITRCKLNSIVDAADRIFSALQPEQVALAAAEFLLNVFDRVVIFDLSVQPALLLCRAGAQRSALQLDVVKHPVLRESIQSGQGLQGQVPSDAMWSEMYADLELEMGKFVMIAPVQTGSTRWLCLADTLGCEVQGDLRDVALLLREITTALSVLDKNTSGPDRA